MRFETFHSPPVGLETRHEAGAPDVFCLGQGSNPASIKGAPKEVRTMVSVVIPTFNRCAQVVEAVSSVMRQKVDALDIVVVDDGSADGTVDALRVFEPAIRVVKQPHGGVSAARNRGITLARYEWIAFLDSDDLWLPRKLSIQMEYLGHHPAIRICQTEEIWVRNGRRLNPRKYHKKPKGHCFDRLLDRCLVSPSAVIIHKSVFDEVGVFDEDLPACEDYDLWLRIGLRHAMGLVEEPLVIKRGGHPDQLSSTIPALDRFRIQALCNLLIRESLSADQKELVRRTLVHKVGVYSAGCMKRGRMDEALYIQSLTSRSAPR